MSLDSSPPDCRASSWGVPFSAASCARAGAAPANIIGHIAAPISNRSIFGISLSLFLIIVWCRSGAVRPLFGGAPQPRQCSAVDLVASGAGHFVDRLEVESPRALDDRYRQ